MRRVNLALKVNFEEARLLRAVSKEHLGGFSGWARAALLREARKQVEGEKAAETRAKARRK